jgi:hypothetical protein
MRKQPIWIAAVVAIAGGGAFLLGRTTAPAIAPSAAASAARPAPTATLPARPSAPLLPAGGGRLDPATQETIRAMLRGEIEAALDERAAAAGEAASAAEAPSEAAFEATERGHAVIRAALETGKWTREDAAALRAQLIAATPAQREELLSTLFPLLNRGELVSDFRGPPM